MEDKDLDVIKDLVLEELGYRVTQSYFGLSTFEHNTANELDSISREKAIRGSRTAATLPIGKQILEAATDFICGSGAIVLPKSKDHDVEEFLDEFNEENNMQIRIPRLVLRTLRDGESYIRYFGLGSQNVRIRFMEPLRIIPSYKFEREVDIANPGTSSGVVTSDDDIESVIGYTFDSQGQGTPDSFIPASEVTHLKLFADDDARHGRPYMEPVLKRIAQYEEWIAGRIALNHAKSGYWLVRKVEGTTAAATTAVDQIVKSTRTGMSNAAKMPPPGSVLTATAGISYEILCPDIDAKDVSEDGKRILLDIAAGVGMPYWIVSADPSEGNRASTITAESPWIKKVQRLQQFFGHYISIIYKTAIQSAIRSGRLSKTFKEKTMTREVMSKIAQLERQVALGHGDDRRIKRARIEIAEAKASPLSYIEAEVNRSSSVEVQWPEIIPRDLDKLVKSLLVMDSLGVVSKRTMASMLDLDFDSEKEYINEELVPTTFTEFENEVAKNIEEINSQFPDDALWKDEEKSDKEEISNEGESDNDSKVEADESE